MNLPNWSPSQTETNDVSSFVASPLQIQNKEYIKQNATVQYAFKKMQAAAKRKELFSAFAWATDVLEQLTGFVGLANWAQSNFDKDF